MNIYIYIPAFLLGYLFLAMMLKANNSHKNRRFISLNGRSRLQYVPHKNSRPCTGIHVPAIMV